VTGWSQMAALNLIGSYNYALVALSVLIAMFASYAALDLAGRVTAAGGWTRAVWLLGGAGAMGTGIWSMHYIGMLAFVLPIPVAYHWPTVLLSLFAAILASVIALYVVSQPKMGASPAVAGSVLMGAGIASMHYIGMAAMRLPATCHFNSFLVVLSVVFAILISLAALWIAFHFRDEKTGIGREKLSGAVVMGAAIPVMHYTGMAAASFTPSGMPADLSHAVSISILGTAGIAGVTFIVLGLALLTSWVDRRFAAQTLELQEEKLQRSEAYLAEAQRLSHTGSFGWRPATGDIIWSEETFRILEFDPAIKPTVELILQRTHPDDRAFVQETIDQAARDRKAFDFEHRLLMPDGSVKYVRVVGHSLTNDESGNFEFVGAVMDVTAAKQVEQTLREREAYLAEAQRLTHTGSGAWRVPEGDALHLSEEWYRIYGFDPKQGLSAWQDRLQRMHPEDQARVQEIKDRAISEKSDYEVDHRIVLPDGTIKYTHTVGHPVLNASGDVEQFVCTMMDVTERKQAEEALRRSEGYLAQAQRLSHTGSWSYSPATQKALYWSDEMFRICGFDPQKGPPTSEAFLERVHPEDRENVDKTMRDAAREKTEYRVEHRIIHPNGTIKHTQAIGHPVLDRSGNVVEFVGSAVDITDVKRAERERERLRQLQVELVHINRVTTMGELSASLAHEIKQPISAAMLDAGTCLKWLKRDKPDIEEARQAVSRIIQDATRASEIIGRIRSLFKQGEPQRERIDVNEVIREMIDLLRSEVMRHSISVRTELAEDIPQITADRVQLQQVMMNLVLNSIDAMKDVGGTRELVICSRQAEGGQLMVLVRDTGVGLPQQADQIFNAFFTTKPHGIGMGLRISRSIVESHGGRLWAADNSPRGASFYLTLPTRLEACA
jgi:PAS domain S-box-containing protein